MKSITIWGKHRPFSHKAGVRLLLAHTTFCVTIYPALVCLSNLLDDRESCHIPLQIQGPVSGFTVTQDLEKGQIDVVGRDRKGAHFRYRITPQGIVFTSGLTLELSLHIPTYPIGHRERLSLGVHKKQELEQMIRRQDMAEILPLWLFLAQVTPMTPYLPEEKRGVFSLLCKLRHLEGEPLALFKEIVQVACADDVVPHLFDQKHQGILEKEEQGEHPLPSPLAVLHEGARQMRRLFFEEQSRPGDSMLWAILPRLPRPFHAGRYVDLLTQNQDRICMEWSKGKIKKMTITPIHTAQVELVLDRHITSYRLSRPADRADRGILCSVKKPLHLMPGQTVYLDRFT